MERKTNDGYYKEKKMYLMFIIFDINLKQCYNVLYINKD